MALYTVVGGNGFIGSEVVNQLNDLGHTVFVPTRDDDTLMTRDLGIVIYCAGNGDCQNTPFAVLEANISLLAKILQKSQFTRLMYISSTRVYMNQEQANEKANLTVCIDDNRRLFNLTKLVGEELCLKSGRDVCILRPSNVYGLALNSPLFLPAITRNAINTGKIDMYIAPSYEKDYVSVNDVAMSTIKLATEIKASQKIVNIAAGFNITAQQIADVLKLNTGCEVIWHDVDFPNEHFPQTDVSIIKKLIPHYESTNVLDDLYDMVTDFKNVLRKT